MAKTNKNELVAVKEFTEEDGSVVRLRQDAEKVLQYCEQQMKIGFLQVAFSLKTIRDERLYFLRDCKNMLQYVEEYLDFSYRHTKRFLLIADNFHSAKTDILEKFSQGTLLELTRHPELAAEVQGAEVEEGEVRLPDGEVMGLREFVNKVTREVRKEAEVREDKLRRRMDALTTETKGKKTALECAYADLEKAQENIHRLEAAIQDLAERKDVDIRKLTFITQKKEAIGLLMTSQVDALKLFGEVDGLPRELIDAEVAGHLQFFISTVETSIERLRQSYEPCLWLAGKKDRPADVVPE